MHWVQLILAIGFEVVGTTGLKASDGFTKLWPSSITVVAYGASLFFLSLSLKVIPVGIAYALWSAIGMVAITAIGWFMFRQHLDAAAIAGISLILLGVIVLNAFSNSLGH